MPVIWPGFAWSNMNLGTRPNSMARSAGQFMWTQASLLYENGVENMYVAMFDEYDESTAIMKAATDSTMLPTGEQYFLSLAADGYWLSSDFYLRLTGGVGKLLRGEINPGGEPPLAHSNGPVYWRNGFERRYASGGELMDIDVGILNPDTNNRNTPKVTDALRVAEASLSNVADGNAHSGAYAALVTGKAAGEGALYRALIAPARITVAEGTRLSFFRKPENNAGRRVFIDLAFADGTVLSGLTGIERGVVGEWTEVVYDLRACVGKEITGVYAVYAGGAGDFTAYVDDICIFTQG
jgi:hypothetical protein